MTPSRWILGVIPLLAATWLAVPARSEIVSISGSASAAIQSHDATGQTGSDQSTQTFPSGDATLPLQVIARLADTENGAAGSAAAQFADPQTAQGPNPEEFAINLALNSLAPDIFYTAQASTEELRGVLLRPADVGLAAVGQTVELSGRLFIDGVLAVFAVEDVTDLTGVTIDMRVTIVKEVGGAEPQPVFAGTLSVAGGKNRAVTATVEGGFPTSGIVDSDLTSLDPELGVFRVFVLPNLILDYPYDAAVGEPFSLRATVEIEAANRPDGVGVAAILGTPVATLQEVIDATRGAAAAKTMMTALQDERAAPTGAPTFPTPTPPPFPTCGLFGLEGLLGLLGLLGMRRANHKPYDRRDADAPRTPNPEPRAPSPGPRAPSPEPRTPSPEPRTPNPEPRAPIPDP